MVSFMSFNQTTFASVQRFSDVTVGFWADKDIHDLRALNITQGIGNNKFGVGLKIKRDEFVTFLVKLMGWTKVSPAKGSFIDNTNTSQWYFTYVETALKNGAITIDSTKKFRPEAYITREEMAIMIVRTMGYDKLAKGLTYLGKPFPDVSTNTGYIAIAKDMGIVSGVTPTSFKPTDYALREQAATMMMKMYNKLKPPFKELHAFYAIQSYSQINMINNLDSVSFGWSRLEYDTVTKQMVLNTSSMRNGEYNEYNVPVGYSEPVTLAQQKNVPAQLMVCLKSQNVFDNVKNTNVSLAEYILTNPEIRKQVIQSITQQVKSTGGNGQGVTFNGVTIDFESMKGTVLKQAFNSFLQELRQSLTANNIKNLYVAVPPQRKAGTAYFDGYDYKTIGQIADKVILMAHDYNAKTLTDSDMAAGADYTPLAPLDEVYYALRAITDKNTGVADLSKICLQISSNWVEWQKKDGKTLNRNSINLTYDSFQQILTNSGVTYNYDDNVQSPYVKFYDSKTGIYNTIWYENSSSVEAKIKLAKMFGVNEISLWRLGNIPDDNKTTVGLKFGLDIWQRILKLAGRS
jgi:spore germination protein YaaH